MVASRDGPVPKKSRQKVWEKCTSDDPLVRKLHEQRERQAMSQRKLRAQRKIEEEADQETFHEFGMTGTVDPVTGEWVAGLEPPPERSSKKGGSKCKKSSSRRTRRHKHNR